jgi:hypothetical protein
MALRQSLRDASLEATAATSILALVLVCMEILLYSEQG